jgi:hypothetical protein
MGKEGKNREVFITCLSALIEWWWILITMENIMLPSPLNP